MLRVNCPTFGSSTQSLLALFSPSFLSTCGYYNTENINMPESSSIRHMSNKVQVVVWIQPRKCYWAALQKPSWSSGSSTLLNPTCCLYFPILNPFDLLLLLLNPPALMGPPFLHPPSPLFLDQPFQIWSSESTNPRPSFVFKIRPNKLAWFPRSTSF